MRSLVILLACSTLAAADDGERVELATLKEFLGIDLIETINDARHEHGGPPAKVHDASLNFEVRDARAHKIEVRSIAIVYDNCGAKKKRKGDVQPRPLQGHELYTWDDMDPIAKGKASVSTPAGKPRRFSVRVAFDGVETYRACGLAFDLVVDRVRAQIELPLRIIRFEPLRKKDPF